MTPLDKLVAYFEKFPGVGVRQARRFAFHVLTLNKENVKELSDLISTLSGSVSECHGCRRYFTQSSYGDRSDLCSICLDQNRNKQKLLVVARDSDIDAIEKSGVYEGLYFVLGGTVPLLTDIDNSKILRGGILRNVLEERGSEGLKEVILGFAVNPDGENTARYVENMVTKINGEGKSIKIAHLGRGLSTGSELEYADPETIKNALRNRT